MKKLLALVLLVILTSAACRKREPLVYNVNKSDELKQYESELAEESAYEESVKAEESLKAQEESIAAQPEPAWTKKAVAKAETRVKGIYLTAVTAGGDRMGEIISQLDRTELNAVVIDIKDDFGHVTYHMDSPLVTELGVQNQTIPDIQALLTTLHEHQIYVIARVVCFRDPYLGEAKPEWMCQKADGTVFKDASGHTWVNPYKRDAWEYIAEIGEQCAAAGFDEVQLDYIRFCTEKGMQDVVFSEEDTQGMGKTDIIAEFIRFMSDRLSQKGVFLSCDVFGTIIGSYVDTMAVGQDYSIMAGAVDYMSPMIYPSHYGNGNFGIEYPDTEPYKTICGALNASRKDLALDYQEGIHQATVRPWLQGFTASYLQHYINYDASAIRQQINAVYDSGYDEWLIWNAANTYNWDAFLTDEQAAAEDQQIAAKRAEEAARAAAEATAPETDSAGETYAVVTTAG